jgi:hypothetical protein
MIMEDNRDEKSRATTAKSRAADDTARMNSPKMDQWSPPSMLELPPDTGDYVFRWIRESVNGHQDSRSVQMRLREGWQRVNISEVPETFLMAVDENTKGDQFCRTGGLILMRLPRKFAEQRQAYYKSRRQERAFAADVLQGVAGANAVQEDRGSRNLDGAEAGRALRDMSRS